MSSALPATDLTVNTTCPYCGVGCGVQAQLGAGRQLRIEGDTQHPANRGLLCSKGTALGSTFGLNERMLRPRIRKQGIFKAVSWDEALCEVARGFNDTIARHGPDAVAFYVSGQLLTEDYYAANKLAKGFIGTANIDTNSRLCMSSAVAAHKLAFGADLVPGIYDDLTEADVLIFSGHNASWTHPVLVRRIEQRVGQMRICIDPRRTDTAKACDLHLMIKPQSDVRLWNGLCAWLFTHDALDHDFIAHHIEGLAALRAGLDEDDQSLTAIAQDCGIGAADLRTFYDAFMTTPKVVSLFSQGSNQSVQGVNKGLSLINAHLLTGKIGKPGAAPFSITGQPNAMGGREVGGLANMLAAHMDFDPPSRARVQRYWQSPRIAERPGLKAVEMFNAVRDGRIKAIWIMATNPVVSMPDSQSVRAALESCPLVVVSDVVARNDTLDCATIQLPAAAWGEKDGTVTNSERMISRQRRIASAPGEARADWAIISGVARRMNRAWVPAFDWHGPADVFDEHAGLTAYENSGDRFLNLAGLHGLTRAEYDGLTPTRWPIASNGGDAGRLFADGRFATPSGKARVHAVTPQGPAHPVSPEFPLSLNSARVRDHWHTLTRTALAPELNRHTPEPLLEIHPADAARLKLQDGRLATLSTAWGAAVLRTRITEDVREGGVCMPMHWTQIFAPSGRSNPLFNPACDARSGQPELKHTPARAEAFGETWHGFLLCARDPCTSLFEADPSQADWHPGMLWNESVIWRRNDHAHARCYELAGQSALTHFGDLFDEGDLLSLDDVRRGIMRRVSLRRGRLHAALFIAPASTPLPARDWLLERFGDTSVGDTDRAALLLGVLPGIVDQGRIVCACRSVGLKRIERAIVDGAQSVEAIGVQTTAGTQCGSCRGELRQCLLAHAQAVLPQPREAIVATHASKFAVSSHAV